MLNKYKLRLLASFIAGVSVAPLSSMAGEPATLTPMGYRVSRDVYVPSDLIARTCTTTLMLDHPRMDFQNVIFLYLPTTPDRVQPRVWGLECVWATGDKEEQITVLDLTRRDRPGAARLRSFLHQHLIEIG